MWKSSSILQESLSLEAHLLSFTNTSASLNFSTKESFTPSVHSKDLPTTSSERNAFAYLNQEVTLLLS